VSKLLIKSLSITVSSVVVSEPNDRGRINYASALCSKYLAVNRFFRGLFFFGFALFFSSHVFAFDFGILGQSETSGSKASSAIYLNTGIVPLVPVYAGVAYQTYTSKGLPFEASVGSVQLSLSGELPVLLTNFSAFGGAGYAIMGSYSNTTGGVKEALTVDNPLFYFAGLKWRPVPLLQFLLGYRMMTTKSHYAKTNGSSTLSSSDQDMNLSGMYFGLGLGF